MSFGHGLRGDPVYHADDAPPLLSPGQEDLQVLTVAGQISRTGLAARFPKEKATRQQERVGLQSLGCHGKIGKGQTLHKGHRLLPVRLFPFPVPTRPSRSDLDEEPPQTFVGDGQEGLPASPHKPGLLVLALFGTLAVLVPDVSGELSGYLPCFHPILLHSSWVGLNYKRWRAEGQRRPSMSRELAHAASSGWP